MATFSVRCREDANCHSLTLRVHITCVTNHMISCWCFCFHSCFSIVSTKYIWMPPSNYGRDTNTLSITMRKQLLMHNIIVLSLLLLWFFYFSNPIFSGFHSNIAFEAKIWHLFFSNQSKQKSKQLNEIHTVISEQWSRGNIMGFLPNKRSSFFPFFFFFPLQTLK